MTRDVSCDAAGAAFGFWRLTRRPVVLAIALAGSLGWTSAKAASCDEPRGTAATSRASTDCIASLARAVEQSREMEPAARAEALIRLGGLALPPAAEAGQPGAVRSEAAAIDLVNRGLRYMPSVKAQFPVMDASSTPGERVERDNLSRWMLRLGAISVLHSARSAKAEDIFAAALDDDGFEDPGCGSAVFPDVVLGYDWFIDIAENRKQGAARAAYLAGVIDRMSSMMAIPAASKAVTDFGIDQEGSAQVIDAYLRYIARVRIYPVVFDYNGSLWLHSIYLTLLPLKDKPAYRERVRNALSSILRNRALAGHCEDYEGSPNQVTTDSVRDLIKESFGVSAPGANGPRLSPRQNLVRPSNIAARDAFARFSASAITDAGPEADARSIVPGIQRLAASASQPKQLEFLMGLAFAASTRGAETQDGAIPSTVVPLNELRSSVRSILENQTVWQQSPSLWIEWIQKATIMFDEANESDELGTQLRQSKVDVVRIFATITKLERS